MEEKDCTVVWEGWDWPCLEEEVLLRVSRMGSVCLLEREAGRKDRETAPAEDCAGPRV